MANQNEPQPQENPLSNFSTLMQEYLELQQQMIQSLTRIEESLIEIRGEFAARNSRREQEVGASINNGGGGVVASINGVGDMEAVAVPGQAESRWHDLSDMLRIVSTVGKYASYYVGVYAAGIFLVVGFPLSIIRACYSNAVLWHDEDLEKMTY